jgi:hypothetical protein
MFASRKIIASSALDCPLLQSLAGPIIGLPIVAGPIPFIICGSVQRRRCGSQIAAA